MTTAPVYCPACGTACTSDANFCLKCGKALPGQKPAVPAQKGSDFITLACPNCGGSLTITHDMERFACQYCGLEHLVRRESGAVSLSPVVEGLKRVEKKFDHILGGTDRMAAEQTLQRLKKEISELEEKIGAKELAIKNYSPGSQTCGTLIFLGALVIFALLAFIIGLDLDYFYYYFVPVVAGIVGLVLLSSQKSPTDKKTYEAAKMELPQLKARLESLNEQADQLHQYTIER